MAQFAATPADRGERAIDDARGYAHLLGELFRRAEALRAAAG